MRYLTQGLFILLSHVTFTHTKWQQEVCEEKHNIDWCLDSFTCIREFLNCKCVPEAAFAGSDSFPDTLSLCFLAYTWEVSEPTCCRSDKKRAQMSRFSDDVIGTDDLMLSLLLEPMQKRNFDNLLEDIINNDSKSKSIDNRRSSLIDIINKYPALKSSITGTPDAYLNSVSKPDFPKTDTSLNSIWKKVVASSNNMLLNPMDNSESAQTNNVNIHSNHKSLVTRTNSLSRHKSRMNGLDNSYRNSEQTSSVEGFDDAYPSSFQESSAIDTEDADPLESLAELLETDNMNDNTVQSKILHLLKCYVERD